MLIIDGHCDSLERAYDEKIELDDNRLMFNLKETKQQKPYIQLMATFINTKYVQQDSNAGYLRGKAIIENGKKQLERFADTDSIIQIQRKSDLQEVISREKLGIVLSTENGAIIGNKIENLLYFYQNGIRVMGITWNDDNLLGCGALTKQDNGLTDFGKQCVKKMDQLGIIIDLSHTSYQTFFDVLALSNNIIATHSCVDKICPHPRNLKDEQIKAIADKNGIIGICFYQNFLTKAKKATIEDIIAHIRYIKKLVGIDYVGLGSDFDGMDKEFLPQGISGVKDMNQFYIQMKKDGFTMQEIEKVMGLNFVRILEKMK